MRYIHGVLSRIHSYILNGIDALLGEAEVDVSQRGWEKTTTVGLAQTAVKESIERVRRAHVPPASPMLWPPQG
jgi:magnesium chelatase family protein